MTPTTLARIAGVLGGLSWLARAVIDEIDGPDASVNGLHWGGLALIALALVGIGAGLVSSSAWWLRVIVAICLPVLVWSVLEVLHDQLADRWVDGVFGVLLAVYCVVGIVVRRRRHRERPPRAPREPRRPHGSHAA